jgi:threonine dehydratase
METTLRLTPYNSSLLRPKHSDMVPSPTTYINKTKILDCTTKRLTIAATLSKPTVEISNAAVTSRESQLHVSTPASASTSPPRMKVSPESLQYPPGFLGAIPERSVNDGGEDILEAMGYLTNILSSKVYDVAIESPLQLAHKLSERLGNKVWLKREDLQPVSFKFWIIYLILV